MKKEEMKKQSFNNREFKTNLGLRNKEPYDYERYRALNKNLTKKMYEYLRGNKSEWKILCGVPAKMQWSNEAIEQLECRDDDDSRIVLMFYLYRYSPEAYLEFPYW